MNAKSFSLMLIFIILSGFCLFALDLKFTSNISMSPALPAVGNNVTFTVSFTPQDDAVTNFKITGGVDTAQTFERTYASIPANAARTDSFTWTSTSGNHTVWFELDPDHLMGDADYSNNRIELAFSIGSSSFYVQPPIEVDSWPFRADLIVSSAKFTKDLTNSDQYLAIFKIKNIGAKCAGRFSYRIYGLDPKTGEDICPVCPRYAYSSSQDPDCAIKPGEEIAFNHKVGKADFSRNLQKKCPSLSYNPLYNLYNFVFIGVDSDNQVSESNKSNNRSQTFRLDWEKFCN